VLIELPNGWTWFLNLAGWPVLQLGLSWAFTKLPGAWFRPGRLGRWEGEGRVYERTLGIRRWKDRLPDAGGWWGGGFAKRALRDADPVYVERFVRETWRGELCHWCALACAPVFFLWNPWWADVIMVGYGVAANLPCILVQRYNRARLQRLLTTFKTSRGRSENRSSRTGPSRAT